MSDRIAPPAAAYTVKLPVYAKRFSTALPAARDRTRARSARWSRKRPVSRYASRLTQNRSPHSTTRKASPARPVFACCAPPVRRGRCFCTMRASGIARGLGDSLRGVAPPLRVLRRILHPARLHFLHVQARLVGRIGRHVAVDREREFRDVAVVAAERAVAAAAGPARPVPPVLRYAIAQRLARGGRGAVTLDGRRRRHGGRASSRARCRRDADRRRPAIRCACAR